ncbi:hypothetical protein [Tenacibaculum ovolyticum]|uniref:hypothetical protein n=1 Tax=Tenacibaculum ovolyticum TaxID=104270 RepID=UPI000410CEA5|nr:hypothetical protein [Tenacibaculum ovolyticum]
MGIIKLQENQNLFDATIQEYGSIEGLFELLEANEITNIAPLKNENEISIYNDIVIKGKVVKRDVVEYYIARGKKPATKLSKTELELLVKFKDCEGIGCMEVEHDFIVYKEPALKPKSCIEEIIYNQKNEGIGYMEVSQDFLVHKKEE